MSNYPGVYRARALQVQGGVITAYVPQVFGDTPISITEVVGGMPDGPSNGWVMFESGWPDFPVWSSGVIQDVEEPPPAPPDASGVTFDSSGLVVITGTTNVQDALEATDAALAARQLLSQKDQASGYAGLTVNARLQSQRLGATSTAAKFLRGGASGTTEPTWDAIAQGDVTGLGTALGLKAPVDAPAFTTSTSVAGPASAHSFLADLPLAGYGASTFKGRKDTVGPPTASTWVTADFVIDSEGNLWVCKTGGTPGTWIGPPATMTGAQRLALTGMSTGQKVVESDSRATWIWNGTIWRKCVPGDNVATSVVPEAWKKIGTNGSTFSAGWTNYSASDTAGGWTHGSFYKDPEGWVHLKGLVNRPVSGSQVAIATLPAGYRPPIYNEVATLSNDQFATIRIWADGVIQLLNPTPTDVRWVNLSGLQFYVGDGTFDGWLDTCVQPTYFAGQGPYVNADGRSAFMQRRDDGLVRCFGFSYVGSTPPAYIAAIPESMRTRMVHMFGQYHWTGSVQQYQRVDTSAGTNIILQAGTYAAGVALNWNGMHWWDQTKDQNFGALTLANSWVNFGDTYPTAGYMKDDQENVWLHGLIKNGSLTVGATLTTLPVNHRPPSREMFHGYGNGVMQRIDVLNTGIVNIGSAWTQNGFQSLDQVWFRAGAAI